MTRLILSRANQQVLVPYTSSIKNLFPDDVKTLAHNGGIYAVLPHNPRTQIKLRAVDIEVPAPVLFHYDWPTADGTKPFAIQKDTTALMTSNQRAYVLSDMGTGKSRASIWAWDYLRKVGAANKLLIVAPLSTLRFTWLHEILMLLPRVKAVVLHGSKQKRLELLAGDYDIYVINHDGLKVIDEELFKRKDIDTLVIDELAVYRNSTSQLSKRMREFARRFTWAWGLTGRPMPTEVTDVWAQAKILTPHRVPKFFRHAQSMLMRQIDIYKWIPREGAVDMAYDWLQPAVRYALDEVVELPEAISRDVEIELTIEQQETYRKLSNEFAAMIKDQRITAANAGVALMKLLQVACGYVYTTNPSYVTLDSEPRQQALLDIIEQAPHKLIVFAPWYHLIGGLTKIFTEHKIDHAVIHGGVSHREQIFDAFQSTTQYDVLLAHPETVHHGITLTAATTIVWYSPVTSLEVYEQACARIRRFGQKHKQQFLHFGSTPIERHVYRMLRGKQKLQDAFLALVQEATKDTGVWQHGPN
jgi:SNF2 family DNA or RNA helicase